MAQYNIAPKGPTPQVDNESRRWDDGMAAYTNDEVIRKIENVRKVDDSEMRTRKVLPSVLNVEITVQRTNDVRMDEAELRRYLKKKRREITTEISSQLVQR